MRIRPQHFSNIATGLLVSALALVGHASALAGNKSDSQIKATATATKPDAAGKQLVTITLDITKDWHIYANPVNFDLLTEGQTTVSINAKVKPASVEVKYPAGKQVVDGKDKYNIYEGKITIQANVRRAPGDTSPLEIGILVQACTNTLCLQPATVKLTVP